MTYLQGPYGEPFAYCAEYATGELYCLRNRLRGAALGVLRVLSDYIERWPEFVKPHLLAEQLLNRFEVDGNNQPSLA